MLPLRATRDVKGNLLVFCECFEALSLNSGEMGEHIFAAAIRGNETKAFELLNHRYHSETGIGPVSADTVAFPVRDIGQLLDRITASSVIRICLKEDTDLFVPGGRFLMLFSERFGKPIKVGVLCGR